MELESPEARKELQVDDSQVRPDMARSPTFDPIDRGPDVGAADMAKATACFH
jgi:hypothetical protein